MSPTFSSLTEPFEAGSQWSKLKESRARRRFAFELASNLEQCQDEHDATCEIGTKTNQRVIELRIRAENSGRKAIEREDLLLTRMEANPSGTKGQGGLDRTADAQSSVGQSTTNQDNENDLLDRTLLAWDEALKHIEEFVHASVRDIFSKVPKNVKAETTGDGDLTDAA